MNTRLNEFIDSFQQADPFHSARLKLTAFYFAVLVVLCLTLTFGTRGFVNYELNRGSSAQRGAAHQLFQQYDTELTPSTQAPSITPYGDRYFAQTVNNQDAQTRGHLNRDYLFLDLVLLALGAAVSYWYAGRTLRPIEEAHEQQKRFTSDASHELRTPLASMRLENEIFLRQKTFSDKDARELISSNLEEVERLEKLASNLLSLNRYEHDKLAHEPVPVSELINGALTRVRKSKAAKKVNFVQDLVPVAVDVNRDSLEELLAILLDNAVKYGPKDGKIEIGGFMQDDRYVVTVRDHGSGIADEDLTHIFERMYRGDKARSSKISGHGIGLSLARQIADANDATLEASNAPGGGALFTLTLS